LSEPRSEAALRADEQHHHLSVPVRKSRPQHAQAEQSRLEQPSPRRSHRLRARVHPWARVQHALIDQPGRHPAGRRHQAVPGPVRAGREELHAGAPAPRQGREVQLPGSFGL